MRRKSSFFAMFVLNRAKTKRRSLKTLITTSTYQMEVAFMKMSGAAVKKVNSTFARLCFLVRLLASKESVAVD